MGSKIKRFVVTYAQNATPCNEKFLSSLQGYCDHNGAELIVVPGRYKNPTSTFAKHDRDAEWWDERLAPYILGKMVPVKVVKKVKGKTITRTKLQMKPGRKQLAPGLVVLGDISVQPTASGPLSRFEVHAGASSVIVGHPKRALQVVPTESRKARVMWTTTACTRPNYTDSKAGKIGHEHHVIGAVVVEVEDGRFHVRHISANWRNGHFYDLDHLYTPEGIYADQRAATLTLGDWHSPTVETPVYEATKRLFHRVLPKALVVHDFLNMGSRNHHERKRLRSLYNGKDKQVSLEVASAVNELDGLAEWGDGTHRTVVVRSNHDEHLERWLDEHEDERDPINAPYYHALWARAYEFRLKRGFWPDLFAMEAKRLKVRKTVRFLRRNESFLVKGVEHGFHGDKGVNGSKGHNRSYHKLGVKVTKGHDHTPSILDNVYSVGVTGSLNQGYNYLPSTWMNAHVVEYADGKRAVIIIIDGHYAGEDT